MRGAGEWRAPLCGGLALTVCHSARGCDDEHADAAVRTSSMIGVCVSLGAAQTMRVLLHSSKSITVRVLTYMAAQNPPTSTWLTSG